MNVTGSIIADRGITATRAHGVLMNDVGGLSQWTSCHLLQSIFADLGSGKEISLYPSWKPLC